MQHTQDGPMLAPWSTQDIYHPAKEPGFVAWATAFDYGNGSLGLSFTETMQEPNPEFHPPRLEFCEAVCAPVSYCSVECSSADIHSYRVYMRSDDGEHFYETGRCPLYEGALCNVGFADGRILGFEVPRRNEAGTGWYDGLRVSESWDGGTTWQVKKKLLPGTAPYLWRVRRLPSGLIVVLTSLYGTPWGQGCERATRNTMLPGESYISKIQTCFLTTRDGEHFTGPHYILPGIGAHEYDVAELPDGRLVFVAGDVQATPVGRQIVTPGEEDGVWINGPLHAIHDGAPADPAQNPQGGYLPETMVYDAEHSCLVGYRRNKCYSISNDEGANWTPVWPAEPLEQLYQPVMLYVGGGVCMNFGHIGGDSGFGQFQMKIAAHRFSLSGLEKLPRPTALNMARLQAPDGSRYLNQFRAVLTSGGQPLAGQRVVFRFNRYWNLDGSVNTTPQADAPWQIEATTDAQGEAYARFTELDGIADIHLAYNVDVVCPGTSRVRGCLGPMMTVLALTPVRRTLYPYDAYFAGGVLFLSPDFMSQCPEAEAALKALDPDAREVPQGTLPTQVQQRLEACGALLRGEGGRLLWASTVHAPRPLHEVKPMSTGDWYV